MNTNKYIEMYATMKVNDDAYMEYKIEYFEEHCLQFMKQICSVFHGKNAYAILGNKVAVYRLSNIDEKDGVPPNAYFRFSLPRLEIGDDPEHYIRTAKLIWQTIPCAADESYLEVI